MTSRRFHLQFTFYSLVSFTTVLGACSGFVLIPYFLYHNFTKFPDGNVLLTIAFVLVGGPLVGAFMGFLLSFTGYPVYAWLASKYPLPFRGRVELKE